MNLRSGKIISKRLLDKEKEKFKGKQIETREINDDAMPPSTKLSTSEYSILTHLRRAHALLSIYDALMILQELRDVLIYALQNPQKFQTFFIEADIKEALHAYATTHITFNNDDMLLETSEHNRSLYVTGDIDETKINRILIDLGSSINLMTLRTLRSLSLDIFNLSKEKIMNQ